MDDGLTSGAARGTAAGTAGQSVFASVAEILALRPLFHRTTSGRAVTWQLSDVVLEFLWDNARPGMKTIETGAGVSTIVFALRGCSHTVITPDLGQVERIRAFSAEHGISLDAVTFITGPSQDLLPSLDLSDLEIALVDGSHSFPVAFIDYYYIGRCLRTGGIMVVDNTNIWTGHILRQFMSSEPEWELVQRFPVSAAFRMVATAPPDLDKDWKEQRYNLRQSRTQLRIGKLRFAADALRREGARAFIAKLLK